MNGKIYIGSSCNIQNRFSIHYRQLCIGNHDNPKLQLSWNKYGANNFSFSTIEICRPEDRLDREQYYINTLNPEYNIAKVVGFPATPKAGTKEAKERGKKIIKSRKDSEWCNSNEYHEMMSDIMVDRWKDPTYKKSRSVNTKSLWNDSEYRDKQKQAHRKIDEVNRERIREMRWQGYKLKDIALAYQISIHTVSRIIKGLH